MKDVEKELLEIVEELSDQLEKDILSHIKDLAQAGEWGVALEDLCNMLFEYDVKISQRIFNRIEKLGIAMSMEKSSWDFIKPLINFDIRL